MKFFGDISKVEEQDDGTVKVWGYASTESKDSDGEIITADAMKAAIPDYMKFGAVREMHKNDAAGTAIEIEVQEDGRTFFGAHVVDPVAVKKVKTQVYKGFSIGGKVLARDTINKTTITQLKLTEVSLVDRPANDGAVFTMYKAEDSQALDDQVVPVEEVAPLEVPAEETTKSEEVVAEVIPEAKDSVIKCMSQVSGFAYLLRDLSWLIEDAAWEAEYEGDNSPIPGRLIEWLQAGTEIFQAMAKEEIKELTARLNAVVTNLPAVAAVKSVSIDDLRKVLGEVTITKTETIEVPAPSVEEDLTKAAGLNEQITKLSSENDLLKAEIAEIKAKPEFPKAALKSVSIDQAKDTVTKTSTDSDDVAPPAGTEARAEWELKKVFKAGGKRLS
jgi:hypothetical protein